uniref:acylglycerol lipase n=1 Tax=Sphenodon punctatus TaxID=8508 RepID=A0A8D0GRZ3_SPHPU
MLTSITDGILCCLLGKTPNAVGPLESVESSDGYSFVEVKPGRVLRVKHAAPSRSAEEAPPSEEEPSRPGMGVVHCKRKITVYRNGQLIIENLGEAVRSDILHCQNGSTEPNSTVELELSDGTAATPTPANPTAKRRKRKPKKTVNIDCKKRITSCKGTQSDVVLFFLHGVGGSLDIWKEQLDFFTKLGYEVVAPDLAGHGASSAPQIAAAYTFYTLAEDIRAVFKRYAKKRNILIGHSYGLKFCTARDNFCSNSTVAAAQNSWGLAGFARQGAKEKQLLKEGNAFNVSSFVLRAMMSGQYWPEGDEVYHAELTVPILLVHGMHDKFVPVEEDQRMAEILLIAFLKVIDEGSHMVMMECPETVNTLLHEFLLWEPESPPAAEEGTGTEKK